MNRTLNVTLILFVGAALSACATGRCPRAGAADAAVAPVAAAPEAAVVPGKAAAKTVTTVLVYKADGSLQCGMGKGTTAEDMEKKLAGLGVTARSKREDGMMHIQACGQATGMANVYEIPESSLAAAEKRGFRRFRP
jgi:hypothetical protein